MKLHKVVSLWFLALLACLVVVLGFRPGRARVGAETRSNTPATRQASQARSDSGVERLSAPARVSPAAASKAVVPSPFEFAARENEQLQASLGWSFGGKLQRGWTIYAPLIANLIGAEADAVPGEFARQLSLWQKENEIQPTGVLDANTWSRMVSDLQARRRIGRTFAAPVTLVTIPVSDCYDPARVEELRKVEPETFAAYKRMVAAAASDSSVGLQVGRDGQLAASEKFLKIVSAFRSREYQDHLRKQSPNSGRAGLAVNSPHSTGRALDLYVGGEPVSTKDDNRSIQTRGQAYRWLVKNAARFGFQPYFYEPWHWEYVGN